MPNMSTSLDHSLELSIKAFISLYPFSYSVYLDTDGQKMHAHAYPDKAGHNTLIHTSITDTLFV